MEFFSSFPFSVIDLKLIPLITISVTEFKKYLIIEFLFFIFNFSLENNFINKHIEEKRKLKLLELK